VEVSESHASPALASIARPSILLIQLRSRLPSSIAGSASAEHLIPVAPEVRIRQHLLHYIALLVLLMGMLVRMLGHLLMMLLLRLLVWVATVTRLHREHVRRVEHLGCRIEPVWLRVSLALPLPLLHEV